MNNNQKQIEALYDKTETGHGILNDPDVAHLTINHNKVLGMRGVPGLVVQPEELDDGIKVKIVVKKGSVIAKPVHMCFGMLPKKGLQRIIMDVRVEKHARISIFAHCIFPNAVDVQHVMDAEIVIEEGAEYAYFERHIHGDFGGVKVIPKAKIDVGPYARFTSEFELLSGRVGTIEIDYESTCRKHSVTEMTARVNGREEDVIKIKEVSSLIEEGATAVLISKIAVRGKSTAEVFNKITATAADAKGHVDCKEIVRDQGVAIAVPIVEVRHPKAHVTHEAAIGSVDSKQLETLMARGLDEETAVELILDGMLRRKG